MCSRGLCLTGIRTGLVGVVDRVIVVVVLGGLRARSEVLDVLPAMAAVVLLLLLLLELIFSR